MRPLFAICCLFAAVEVCAAQSMTVSPDRPSCVYGSGDTVRWTIEWKEAEAAPSNARYVVKSGGLKEIAQGDVTFADRVAKLESKFDGPGTLLVEVKWGSHERPKRAFGGAVASPDQVTPAVPPPEDFDAFWKAKLNELAKVPPNEKLHTGESGKPNVDYWKITLDNIRGTHVNGQIARPKQGEKLPGLLILQWAGVYALQKGWVTDRAAEGWLAMNVLPHDLPIDEPESFYKQQYDGPLKNYWAIGNDEPDTSYYLRMYLSCVRALQYLRVRPDWGGIL